MLLLDNFEFDVWSGLTRELLSDLQEIVFFRRKLGDEQARDMR